MYFESLNSSLGPERSVEELDADPRENLALEPGLSRQTGEAEFKRIGQANDNAGSSYSRAPVEGESVEVPPPAYEEVMEQTARRKT